MSKDAEIITHYFFRAWSKWEEAHTIGDWMKQGMALSDANICLYQAMGIAGLRWPWGYKLGKRQ